MKSEDILVKIRKLNNLIIFEKDSVNKFLILGDWDKVTYWQWRAFCTSKALRKLVKLEKNNGK